MIFKKIKALVLSFLKFVNNVISALAKFVKSSYLSLFFLGIILLLVQSLDQANTLLVDMVESDKISLIFCFAIISIFASVLAHYPRYIYYAENINDSRDDHYWYVYKWLGYAIFTFSKINKNYEQDYKAKYFRHCLGLVIYIIWHYYIYETFYPKFFCARENIELITWFTILFAAIPPFILLFLLHGFDRYQDKTVAAKTSEEKKKVTVEKRKFYARGVIALLASIALVIITLVFILFLLEFSVFGYWLLQVFTLLLAIMYVFFRVFRVYIRSVYYKLYFISDNISYLRYYFVCGILIIAFLVFSNFAVYLQWEQANAMLILLCVFFIVYYTLACLLKYFFMINIFENQKETLSKNSLTTSKSYLYRSGVNIIKRSKLLILDKQKAFAKRRKVIASIVTFTLIVICVISYNTESTIHELQVYDKVQNEDVIDTETFKSKLVERSDKPLFYVTSHGGGLKANIWTMKVLNGIQAKTNGAFLNQTVSFSGASGGMMGVSLYSILEGKHVNDYSAISDKINDVAKENFASKDLAFTFGFDFIRKFYPFKYLGKYRDRSYYSMTTYRNVLEGKTSNQLDSLSFNAYWKQHVFNKKNYFPSLIVNTAKTNGKRGIFYSVKYPKDSIIFPNSDNLSQLHNGAIGYYEAISSTNRFPALSPAAKIKSYGHYIDAGALDNSGLLSTLDLFNYFQKDSRLRKTKKVFVEIINGRSNYIRYLVKKFKKENNISDFVFDEKEQDNIIADLKTGLNLDKIPNYLSDFLESYSEKDTLVEYMPIYLPFQIEFKEVEGYIGGEIKDTLQVDKLIRFLNDENRKVKHEIDDNGSVWKTYEPTLARHLSKSTIEYYDRVLGSDLLKNEMHIINRLLNKNQ